MAEKMQWAKLINDKRFGLEQYHNPNAGARSDFQRDYDRLEDNPLIVYLTIKRLSDCY